MTVDHAREHITRVGIGLDTVQLAGLDQCAEDRPAGASTVASGEQIILAPERHRPDCALDRIGVELDAAVVQESREALPPRERIAHGFGEFPAAGQLRKLRFQPRLQGLDDRPGERLSRRQAMCRRLSAYPRLDGIEAGDPTQGLMGQRRVLGLGDVIELAPGMCPTGRQNDVATGGQTLEPGIAIDVQHALEVLQMRGGPCSHPNRAVRGHRPTGVLS